MWNKSNQKKNEHISCLVESSTKIMSARWRKFIKKTLDTSRLESGERLTRALIQMSCPRTGNEFMNWKNGN